jgi:hypothetical protein
MRQSTKRSTTKKPQPARSSRRNAPDEKSRPDWLNRSPLITIEEMKPGFHKLRYADPKQSNRAFGSSPLVESALASVSSRDSRTRP